MPRSPAPAARLAAWPGPRRANQCVQAMTKPFSHPALVDGLDQRVDGREDRPDVLVLVGETRRSRQRGGVDDGEEDDRVLVGEAGRGQHGEAALDRERVEARLLQKLARRAGLGRLALVDQPGRQLDRGRVRRLQRGADAELAEHHDRVERGIVGHDDRDRAGRDDLARERADLARRRRSSDASA